MFSFLERRFSKKTYIWIASSAGAALIIALLLLFLLPGGKVENPEPVIQVTPSSKVNLDTQVVFDASNSNLGLPQGRIQEIRYEWDFGDGSTAQGEKATHNYKQPGNYQIELKLEVIDQADKLRRESTTFPIEVGPPALPDPVAEIDYQPQKKILTLEDITFDASTSHLEGKASPTLNLEWKYEWDFGDGKGITRGEKQIRSFNPPRQYNVTLRVEVTDQFGRTKSAEVTKPIQVINRQPKVVAKAEPNHPRSNPTKIVAGKPVVFNASKTQDPDEGTITYGWDFNNDKIIDKRTQEPRVSYSQGFLEPGDYTVILKVWDDYMMENKQQPVVHLLNIHVGSAAGLRWPSPGPGPKLPSPLGPFVISGSMLALDQLQLWNASIGYELKEPPLSILLGYGANTTEEVRLDRTDQFPEVRDSGYHIYSKVTKATIYNASVYYQVQPRIYVGGGAGFLTLEGTHHASCRVKIQGKYPPVQFREEVTVISIGVGYKLGFALVSFQLIYPL